jgi:hypothetical protein
MRRARSRSTAKVAATSTSPPLVAGRGRAVVVIMGRVLCPRKRARTTPGAVMAFAIRRRRCAAAAASTAARQAVRRIGSAARSAPVLGWASRVQASASRAAGAASIESDFAPVRRAGCQQPLRSGHLGPCLISHAARC